MPNPAIGEALGWQGEIAGLDLFGDGRAQLQVADGVDGRGDVIGGEAGDVEFDALEARDVEVAEVAGERGCAQVLGAAFVDQMARDVDVQVPVQRHVVGDVDPEITQLGAGVGGRERQIRQHQLPDRNRSNADTADANGADA